MAGPVNGGLHIGGLIDRTFGLRPIFPGFVVNTLFYAALWGAILFASRGAWRAFTRWRRSRRGLCPRCAYDLAGSSAHGCPECGWNRMDTGVRIADGRVRSRES